MKQTHFIGASILLLASISIIGFIIISLRTPQNEMVACPLDVQICVDGNTVSRIPPTCEFAQCAIPDPLPVPETENASSTGTTTNSIETHKDIIVVETPLENATITAPILISGKARGNWYFEGSFPITVVDWDGKIIGEGHGEAEGEWMTEDFVPFTASVDFTVATDTPYRRGAIILKKDNPSGLPENNDAIEIPVSF